jgi:hypothetical protein
MHNPARQTRDNRTITVDFQSEATYFQLLGDRKASLGLQLNIKPPVVAAGA